MSFSPGFDFDEAKQCLALSADVANHTPTTTTDEEAKAALVSTIETDADTAAAWPLPVPGVDGWEIVVNPTESIGLDNYWRMYRSQARSERYAVAVRGTISTAKSVLADILMGMLKAKSHLGIRDSGSTDGYTFDFTLAESPDAGVHHGFTYSLGALLNSNWEYSLANHMSEAVSSGAREFFVTGHSQGAAIATLLRSYLRYQPLDGDIAYKTYVYAQPKPGNDYLANDFNQSFANPALAYRLTNSLDWVPQTPFTIEVATDVNTPNPVTALPHLLEKGLEELFEKIIDRLRSKSDAWDTLEDTADEEDMVTFGHKVLSANYAGMANPVSLRGDPAIGDDHESDMFAQHHLGTYWALMKKHLAPGA